MGIMGLTRSPSFTIVERIWTEGVRVGAVMFSVTWRYWYGATKPFCHWDIQ